MLPCVKLFSAAALLATLLATAADSSCAGGSCGVGQEEDDETSLVQLKKTVLPGGQKRVEPSLQKVELAVSAPAEVREQQYPAVQVMQGLMVPPGIGPGPAIPAERLVPGTMMPFAQGIPGLPPGLPLPGLSMGLPPGIVNPGVSFPPRAPLLSGLPELPWQAGDGMSAHKANEMARSKQKSASRAMQQAARRAVAEERAASHAANKASEFRHSAQKAATAQNAAAQSENQAADAAMRAASRSAEEHRAAGRRAAREAETQMEYADEAADEEGASQERAQSARVAQDMEGEERDDDDEDHRVYDDDYPEDEDEDYHDGRRRSVHHHDRRSHDTDRRRCQQPRGRRAHRRRCNAKAAATKASCTAFPCPDASTLRSQPEKLECGRKGCTADDCCLAGVVQMATTSQGPTVTPFTCIVGDAVEAIWKGDGMQHLAIITAFNFSQSNAGSKVVTGGGNKSVTVTWMDGDTTMTLCDAASVWKYGKPCFPQLGLPSYVTAKVS